MLTPEVDLMASLDRAIQAARAAQEAQASRDQQTADAPRPPRILPPKDQGDVVLTASAVTLRLCAACDHAIHVGTPVVTHWPVEQSRRSDPYHPNCWEQRS